MIDVLISIQPRWCELIANGSKTLEIRKTRPKLETPFKCYIYCTKKPDDANNLLEIHSKDGKIHRANGKVIGEFICDGIVPLSITYSDPNSRVALKDFPYTCLTDKEIINYLGNGKQGYGWHISNIVIYDKPKELSEFYRECEKTECDACPYLHFENTPNSYEGWCECDEKIPLTRPPQSWCYVESLVN